MQPVLTGRINHEILRHDKLNHMNINKETGPYPDKSLPFLLLGNIISALHTASVTLGYPGVSTEGLKRSAQLNTEETDQILRGLMACIINETSQKRFEGVIKLLQNDANASSFSGMKRYENGIRAVGLYAHSKETVLLAELQLKNGESSLHIQGNFLDEITPVKPETVRSFTEAFLKVTKAREDLAQRLQYINA
jgi:hypothetical protein